MEPEKLKYNISDFAVATCEKKIGCTPQFHKTKNMKRITMVLVSIMMLMMKVSTASADTNVNVSSTDDFDWTPVMEAIIQVESEGNPKAKSGSSVGVMQITPILVAECNDILKRRKSKKRFTLSDRFSIAKSKEMFLLIQSVHNPLNSIEQAIRAWNGGNHYSVKRKIQKDRENKNPTHPLEDRSEISKINYRSEERR